MLVKELQDVLQRQSRTWAVTGVAGFIGSHLLQNLLRYGQRVAGVDNFATGRVQNLDDVRKAVTSEQWARFRFIEGDIRNLDTCRQTLSGCEVVLHEAALGSVPRSLNDPVTTNDVNVGGTLNVLRAATEARVRRVVYASSSSVYGSDCTIPKREDRVGDALSPYAVSKYTNELYARVFSRCYGLSTIGLRYFNVFGPRQDPEGPYAAVIPKWIAALLGGDEAYINGDGTISRDFCYVANVVQINIRAALVENERAENTVYNVALNARTSLTELYGHIRRLILERCPQLPMKDAIHRPPRAGDIEHSQADIAKARALLAYEPTHDVRSGLRETVAWYIEQRAVV